MPLTEKRKFQLRINKRTYKHGNWRQVVVDCGGMCIIRDEKGFPCGKVENLQFHEPFGEDKVGWGIMQSRILVCLHHHILEHDGLCANNWQCNPSQLNEDVSIEILIHGGYDQWVKDFHLQDTFGRLLF